MRDFFPRLLTHEVQIALSSECMSNETNHFMELYPTINNWSQRHEHTHVCVHLCIHQVKGQCLVTNQCLEQFKKTLKKTLGCNRSVSKPFFFVCDPVLVPKETSCHCQQSSGHGDPAFWSVHCVMCNIDLVCSQKLRQGCPWAEPGLDASPNFLFFPLQPSPWLLGLLDWWDWVHMIKD